jgi:predicted  nucleic acid-binding Zn-ribbon protein
MSETALRLIEVIRSKSAALKQELVLELQKNAELLSKIEVLENAAIEKENELSSLRESLVGLEKELASANEQVVNPVVSGGRNDEEIDELVKEIEYCISQLKNNE